MSYNYDFVIFEMSFYEIYEYICFHESTVETISVGYIWE